MLRYHRNQILPIHPIIPICPNFQFQQPPFCLPSMWVLCAFFETTITATKSALWLFYTKATENQPSTPFNPQSTPSVHPSGILVAAISAHFHPFAPLDPSPPPFVPCPGIPCPPFPRLCPVPGRLRPPQCVVPRQGLQPVKKRLHPIENQSHQKILKKNFHPACYFFVFLRLI